MLNKSLITFESLDVYGIDAEYITFFGFELT